MKISGLWHPSPSGLKQAHELHADAVEIIGTADPQVCVWTISPHLESTNVAQEISHPEEVPQHRVSPYYSPLEAQNVLQCATC